MTKITTSLLILLFSFSINAEPWINTQDVYLRSDIETLADIGVIKVPITTYPLMWSGIIKDLEAADISSIPFEYKNTYWRVKKAGKAAFSLEARRELSASFSNSEQVLRSFGDSHRGRAEIKASSASMNKRFAWNVQVSRVNNPQDGDQTRYDGSYVSVIWENWTVTAGKVDKWWGPSWDTANLLSNNARPPLGVSLTRNYSNQLDEGVFSWLGDWSATGFVSQLDDKRAIKNPIFSGLSVSLKPIESLETSIRITSLSGGKTDTFVADFDDKRITAIDLRWRLPDLVANNIAPTNLYFSITDEGQEGNYATKQFGLSSRFSVLNTSWRVYLEHTDTRAAKNNGTREFNQTYEDGVYRTGYRYNQRAIGSSFDNDSKVLSLGLLGNISRYQSLSLKFQRLKINQNEIQSPLDNLHTVSSKAVNANRILINWKYHASRNHQFEVVMDYSDRLIDSTHRLNEKARISLSWSYLL